MSGLFGYAAWDVAEDVSRVVTSMELVSRHLPHQHVESRIAAPGVGFGRRHIGILNAGQQPVTGLDGRVQVWLSGEFYHQDDLRRLLERTGELDAIGDDESLALAVYLRQGAEGLTRLKGAFVIALWDGRTGELVVVNDRYGMYPHYFAKTAHAFAFAPELKVMLAAPGIRRTMNRTAIIEYLRFQQHLGDKTWLEDVTLLPPASVLRYCPEDHRLTLDQYWDWGEIGYLPDISFDEAVDETSRLFQRAIDEMTSTDQRFGVFLSGGMDSRTIVGYSHDRVPLTTFTYGQPGCRDVVYAAEIARRAGTAHRWFPFHDGRWIEEHAPLHLKLTEGMHSWMHQHGISMLPAARESIDINLSGWDGGSVLLGVVIDERKDRHLIAQSRWSEGALVRAMFAALRREFTWPGLTDEESAELLAGTSLEQHAGDALQSVKHEVSRMMHYPADPRPMYFYMQQCARRSTKGMVAYGRSSVEFRCPFYDYELVDFVFSLPTKVRTDRNFYRSVLTRRAPHLATIPYEWDDRIPHGNKILHSAHAGVVRAKHIINHRIKPIFPQIPTLYADYEEYLRTDLRRWAEDILFDEETVQRGLFDQDIVRSLWERHLSGRELWTIGKVAPLIEIERVHRYLSDDDAGMEGASAGTDSRAWLPLKT